MDVFKKEGDFWGESIENYFATKAKKSLDRETVF